MMKLGIIVVVVLLLLAAGGFAVYYFWFHQPEQVTQTGEEVDVPVSENMDVLGELSGPDPGTEPDFAFTGDDAGSRAIEAPVGEQGVTGENTRLEAPVDLSETASNVGELDPFGGSEETLPIFPGETPESSDVLVLEPTDTPRPERTPVSITMAAEPAATSMPQAATATATPGLQATAQPVAGNFSVKTLVPVLQAKLPAIRTAMKKLGVTLKEETSGRQQHIQGTRIALGYFRTKAEATSWAENYLRPKGVTYFVYPTRNMYSIQVGVYTQQQNVEKMMRTLYQKFPGWRLPVRTEPYAFTKSTFHLSLSKITEALGRTIQDTLFKMGVQAELAGA